jgi:hypothetical protein
MSTSAKTLTPEQIAALQKAQGIAQQQALDKYLSERVTQYGATPKGAKSDTGWTAGEALANPFAGLKDFGKKNVDIYGTDELIGNVVGQEERAKTASDLMREKFGEQLGHKSTFTKAYKKDEKGNPVEVELDSLTPEELNSGNVVLFMGGKTGGESRERMAQAYIPKGDKLIPIGDPKYYKGEHPDAKNVATALKVGSLLAIPFGGVSGLLSGVTGTAGAAGAAGAALGELGINTAGSGLAGTLASAGLPSFAADAGAKALVSGVLSGGLGKLSGQPFSTGFKTGATSSLASDVIGAGVNKVAPDMFKGLGSLGVPAKSIATSALTSGVLGRPFDLGQAAKGAAINYGLNQAISAGGKELGIDPKQQAALMKFYNFAAPLIAARRKSGGP